MFMQVLSSGEANTCAAFAVFVRTETGSFRATVLAVYFALVAEETTRVGEAADVFAAGLVTDVRAVVFVHVFTVQVSFHLY